jgi:hypothetical protein
MTDFHGTIGGYTNHRCRCDDCRVANREYMRSTRARFKLVPAKQIPHGTTGGYRNYACRCDPCREAHVAYSREYRMRRR